VPVGTVLALITPVGGAATGETVTDTPAAEQAEAEQPPMEAESEVPVEPAPPSASPHRIAASPSARRLAAELGVDLATVQGSGPHGVIQRIDVEQAGQKTEQQQPAGQRAAAAPPSPAPASQASGKSAGEKTAMQQDGMRQAIAAAMSRSNRDIPHYYLDTEIDMSQSLQWLEQKNLKLPIRERILPAVLLLKAVARALRDVPELNGYWLDDRLQVKPDLHIGFALALRQGGLITPAIHHVDTLSLQELMQVMGDLIERTRAGRLRSSEMTDGTITMTNLGDRGVKTVYGVIYPPQVALVGFGRIQERPWAEGGMLAVRRCLTATLAADHRATDGHRGAQFLEDLNRYLQLPEEL
jgi:pyruvate dehydrogenase E2 component (dihydrolipoamide acetyltransferase)